MTRVYQIIVQGHLDADWSEEFAGLRIMHRCDGTSLLSGPLTDQSMVQAVLLRVGDLGLSLLSLTRIESEPETEDNPT